MEPYSFTWIFALTVVFAVFDAYSIGANDVANSFATSVGSRSLKLWHAVVIALFTESAGALLLGAATTDTIKNNIIKVSLFKARPELLMEGFMCALIASSSWVMFATYMGWPVSTTHSIVGALTGIGISAFGVDAVDWTFDGMAKIIISWFTSPVIAAIVASIVYLITKYTVLHANNSLRAGIYAIPWYFAISLSIMFFYVGLKNGRWKPVEVEFNWVKGWQYKSTKWADILIPAGVIFASILVIGYAFVAPYFIRLLEKEEDLKWYHVFYIWFVPEQPKNERLSESLCETFTPGRIVLVAGDSVVDMNPQDANLGIGKDVVSASSTPQTRVHHTEGGISAKVLYEAVSTKVSGMIHNSLFADVASMQSDAAKTAHEVAVRYDNKTEYLYSLLQVCTAAFASFAHGSNDVANAVGPLAGVYDIWVKGATPGSKIDTQIWILAIGAVGIDLGLALYGYNIMKSLGNNLTYHSPTRGFSMELGAALTVITGSFFGVPLSTTHCITGATVGVGLCNGSLNSINWTMFAWCFFSWILTVPLAATGAGLLYALLTRGGSFSY